MSQNKFNLNFTKVKKMKKQNKKQSIQEMQDEIFRKMPVDKKYG